MRYIFTSGNLIKAAMKRISFFLMIILMTTAGSFSGIIYAQEGSITDQQREKELQRAIDEQKKAFEVQRKAQEQSREEMRRNMRELEKLQDLDIEVDENGNNVRIYRRGNRSYSMPENFVFPGVPDAPGAPQPPMVYIHSFGGDAERTAWDFTKTVKENSFKKEYSFDVEKTVKSVTMSVAGDCNAGEIRIKIITPQGKTYSDVVIDEFGNINVRKSFNISEEENMDKVGEWKFQINSDKATGYFKISFHTY